MKNNMKGKIILSLAAASIILVKTNLTYGQQIKTEQQITENHQTENESIIKLEATPAFAQERVPIEHDLVYERLLNNLGSKGSTAYRAKLQKSAKKWFPVIVPILKKYGIPEDFKFMPMIESGFKANARSRVGAVGFWQFMPKTARYYGLVVNRKRDDRKSIIKSTNAACKYLKDLYKILGSWTLVAAAYNVGHNALNAAMDRQDNKDYYSLALNKETANYVYKLVAFKALVENKVAAFHQNNKNLPPLEPIDLMFALNGASASESVQVPNLHQPQLSN